MSNRIQDTQGSNQTRKVLESSAFTHGGAYQSLMDFIGDKFEAEETTYSEVIGTLYTLKTMYKAQWKAICDEMVEDDNECDCGCCEVKPKDAPKLQ